MELDLTPVQYKQKPREIPLYKSANWDNISEDLLAASIQTQTNTADKTVNEMWIEFKEDIGKAVEKHIPHRRTKSRDNLPWVTPQIRKLLRKRDRLSIRKKRQQKMGSDVINTTVKRLKALKRGIQCEMRKAYWSYVESIINPTDDPQSHTGRKRFLTSIKHRKTDTIGIKSLCDKGRDETKPAEIATLLNDNFQEIFTTKTLVRPDLLSRPSPYTDMADINITESGVLKLLKSLKARKAPGPDQISPCVLKEMANVIAPILTTIFRKSYDSGTVPEDWKTANITPVFKKGKRSDAANYRPISLTCIVCKLMEHILTSHIMKHANDHNILYGLQHGFRGGRSCETQLVEFIDDLAYNMQNGGQTDVAIMDFSKAFHKVGHQRLLLKLDHYGIRGKTNKWIQAFLTNRSQRVVLNGEHSCYTHVKSGVPQGSVLGPFFFFLC